MNCMKVITEYRVYQNLNLLGVKLFLTPLLLQYEIKFATRLFVCQSLFLTVSKNLAPWVKQLDLEFLTC